MFLGRVFLPFALGYFLSQWFRSVNAVVSADLVRELSLDAWSIGLLTSSYFLAFALAQIPVGVALDRFGARRTESFLLVLAAFGALLFGAAESVSGLVLGRGLIGLGVSACLMASFHAFVVSAPQATIPFWNGAVMTAGALGALSATAPVEWALSFVTWRELFSVLALLTLLAAAFLFVRALDPSSPPHRSPPEVNGLSRVFRSRAFWRVAPLSIAHQGSYLAIQSLWAGPWLADVGGFPRREVASLLVTLALGMALGYLGLGSLAERLGRRGISPLAVWIASALLFQASQAAILREAVEGARALWFVFGFSGASGMLSYVILSRRFPLAMTGRVNASLNVLVFLSAFAIQAAIGAIIAWRSPAESFSPEGYRLAFSSVVGLQTLCLFWLVAGLRHLRDDPKAAPVC